MVFKQFGVILKRTSSIEGGKKLELKRMWDLFEEQERGESKGKEQEEEGSVGDDERAGREQRQREDVWCGVYFGLRKEVWLGTSEGWVWRKGNKVEKKKVEGGVRVMAVVGSQVFFFFFFFFLKLYPL